MTLPPELISFSLSCVREILISRSASINRAHFCSFPQWNSTYSHALASLAEQLKNDCWVFLPDLPTYSPAISVKKNFHRFAKFSLVSWLKWRWVWQKIMLCGRPISWPITLRTGAGLCCSLRDNKGQTMTNCLRSNICLFAFATNWRMMLPISGQMCWTTNFSFFLPVSSCDRNGAMAREAERSWVWDWKCVGCVEGHLN